MEHTVSNICWVVCNPQRQKSRNTRISKTLLLLPHTEAISQIPLQSTSSVGMWMPAPVCGPCLPRSFVSRALPHHASPGLPSRQQPQLLPSRLSNRAPPRLPPSPACAGRYSIAKHGVLLQDAALDPLPEGGWQCKSAMLHCAPLYYKYCIAPHDMSARLPQPSAHRSAIRAAAHNAQRTLLLQMQPQHGHVSSIDALRIHSYLKHKYIGALAAYFFCSKFPKRLSQMCILAIDAEK
ncbi:hypothetical protein GQ54DRAFT_47063 [Martensiomyces pterosporus]|nr:hypothetical protein GQ54DRAFT_47063 [Martensiomyces pterosporus]